MGLWPLLGAIFMSVMFREVIPTLPTTAKWIGLGSIGLGFIPMIYYWSKGHVYFNLPTKEERIAALGELEQIL